jgi:hypothetical protein
MRIIIAFVPAVVALFCAALPAQAADFPMPLPPGRVLNQDTDTAVVRSNLSVEQIQTRLDRVYVHQLGCGRLFLVNSPRYYVCGDTTVLFTFSALDPFPLSQTNAYLNVDAPVDNQG